ncbi:HAD family hydrolase [Bacillus niameyensis]|uniref:HAD family hydrolase n=1 Tax=Bacillus niameyensis TaxID=1522308 RepID=UPI000780C185|nr:HAD family hydrolase [Bacillus niameyensis]
MKKWITFDLDETLMQNPFGKWVFPEVENLVSSFHIKDGILKKIRNEHKRRMDQQKLRDAYDWDNIIKQVLREEGIQLEINIESLVRKHSIPPKVYLLEENLLNTLDRVKQKGFSLGVVTNGFYKYQFPVMESIGLADVMDMIVTPCQTDCAKPDISMVKRLPGEGEIVAHVGDRLDHDVSFANELGIQSILIDREMPEEMRKLAPVNRAQQTEYVEKLFKKGIYRDLQFEKKYIPNIIIHSIYELLEKEMS